MPKHRSLTYIAEGFVEDCDELINQCSLVGQLNYHVFSNIWKDMGFPELYEGRTMQAEIAELSEEVLFIAKRYMLDESQSFEASVAGLFLVYGLLNTQPYEGFAALRLIPNDMVTLKKLESTAREQKRLDVLYILWSVLIKGPCEFHVAERSYGMDIAHKKYMDGLLNVDPRDRKVQGTFTKHNEELALLQELDSLSNRYAALKADICSDKPDPSLQYSDDKLAAGLKASLEKIISGCANYEDNTKKEELHSNDGDSARSIKAKAMVSIVQKVRHFTGVDERPNSIKSIETQENNSIVKKPKKGTVGKITKRRTSHVKTFVDDNDSEPASNIVNLNGDVEIQIIDHMEKSKDGTLDLNTFSGLPIIQTDDTSATEIDTIEKSTPTSTDINKQLEKPSLFIKDEEKDMYYQVEIIDDVVEKLKNLPDIAVTMVNEEKKSKTNEVESKTTKRKDDHIFKKPPIPKLRRIEMKDLKRLKTKKLERCGMLHLMNNDDDN